MRDYTLYIFNKKGGKLVKGLDSKGGKGMLGLYALKHITKSRVGVIVDSLTNQIYDVFEGRENRQAKVYRVSDMGILDYLEIYMLDETHITVNDLITKYVSRETMGGLNK